MATDDIDQLRREIDRLDEELAELIEKRAAHAKRIGDLKAGAPAYRPERESQILAKVMKKAQVLAPERMGAVFREIISACRGL
jgi:chorismate mutase / prephenate dehydratase